MRSYNYFDMRGFPAAGATVAQIPGGGVRFYFWQGVGQNLNQVIVDLPVAAAQSLHEDYLAEYPEAADAESLMDGFQEFFAEAKKPEKPSGQKAKKPDKKATFKASRIAKGRLGSE